MLFLDWCQRAGFCNLEDIEPIHVAAYKSDGLFANKQAEVFHAR